MVLFSVLAIAQNKTTINSVPNEPVHKFKNVNGAVYRKTNPSFSNKTASMAGSAWFNQLDFLELVQAGVPTYNVMHIFPDSTIILGFDAGGQPVNPFIHKAAIYMDPSFMAQQTIIDDKTVTYTCDSVSVGYLYERNTGLTDNTADSLIIQIIAENHALDWNLGTTVSYQDIEYNPTTNNIKASTPLLKRLSIPLTYADTCSGGVYKQIKVATPGITPQTNSKKIGAVLSFKPGYTFTPTDILIGDATNTANKNLFMIISAEQNGAGTDPTNFGTLGNYYTADMTMSMVLPTDSRYNLSSTGWNGYFLPTYAYTTPFAYESHDIGFKLTNISVGVKELENSGFALGQNIPNPFSGSSKVNFQLVNDANSAVFTVTDIMGRVVTSEKVGTSAGIHSVKLGSYAAGVYYYSLNVDGKVTTKKMIVE